MIQQVGNFMRMVFGELDGRASPRGEKFLALCLKAGSKPSSATRSSPNSG